MAGARQEAVIIEMASQRRWVNALFSSYLTVSFFVLFGSLAMHLLYQLSILGSEALQLDLIRLCITSPRKVAA